MDNLPQPEGIPLRTVQTPVAGETPESVRAIVAKAAKESLRMDTAQIDYRALGMVE